MLIYAICIYIYIHICGPTMFCFLPEALLSYLPSLSFHHMADPCACLYSVRGDGHYKIPCIRCRAWRCPRDLCLALELTARAFDATLPVALPETLASLANSGTSNLGGLGKLHWWWGAQCSHSAFWNLVVPCDPKITLEKWMAVVNLMWIWDIIFYSKPVEDLELSQKPTSGTKGAANDQCRNEMLPILNLWCHNLIDLTPFYQVMSSWFKLRNLMWMKETTAFPKGRVYHHGVWGMLIWTPNNFHGLLFPTSNANQLQANELVFFWEWKNSATWHFEALNQTQDLVVSPPKKANTSFLKQTVSSFRWPASWRSIAAKKRARVWSKNRMKIEI